jgi:hypothetical protein
MFDKKYIVEKLTLKHNKKQLNEGHQVREYRGFTLSMDDDFLDAAEEDGEAGPGAFLVNIKLNGESLEVVKGFRAAR